MTYWPSVIPPPDPAIAWMALAYFLACVFAFHKIARPRIIIEERIVEVYPELKPATEPEDDLENIYAEQILPTAERRHPELIKRIRATARELAASGREITTDDIHEAMPLPSGIDGRILGSAFFPRADWRKVGYTPSRRKENHSRPISRWVLRKLQA